MPWKKGWKRKAIKDRIPVYPHENLQMKSVSIFFTCLFVLSLQGKTQNNAISLDGNNDYIFVAPNSNYNISQGTIECWIKPQILSAVGTILGIRGSGGTKFAFYIDQTSLSCWNGSDYQYISYTFTADVWYHLALVCNGTTITCYINGVNAGQLNLSFGTVTGQPLVIGAVKEGSANANTFYGGLIDEVRMWNSVRTEAQILANKNVTLTGTESGLILLYTFNQGVSFGNNAGLTNIDDQTSVNNDATLYNFALSGSSSNYLASILSGPVQVNLPWLLTGNSGTTATNFLGTINNEALVIKTNNVTRLRLQDTGNVGIGIDTPNVKLAVNGDIKTTEIIVTQTPWADHVFHKSYRLLSLHEVEKFISVYKHLPDIPSGAEVEKNGIDVGYIQGLLLQKIEELTLYTIEQDKKLNIQKSKILALKRKVDSPRKNCLKVNAVNK
jgi:hypothetical protein